MDLVRNAYYSALWHLKRMPERAIRHGLAPATVGWRWRKRESLFDYVARVPDAKASLRTYRSAQRLNCPLPRNMTAGELATRGELWGYAMSDVPARKMSATYIATLRDCRFLFFDTPSKRDFFPALIGPDGQSIEAKEISHRAPHARQARAGNDVQYLAKGTWFLERACHNHSHWLTAHLPKLLFLKQHDSLSDLILPERRTPVMDRSMRMLGIEPRDYATFHSDRPLVIDELKLVGADRFDPELLSALRNSFARPDALPPTRKVMISRDESRGRRLLNERELRPVVEHAGFEIVRMEDLDFGDQVRLMQETRVLLAPHGAGLTNMIFCPTGGHIVELADPGFPNPNFYALSCSMNLHYWLIQAEATKAANPLDRDLRVELARLKEVLERIE
ncbi:glycosyltransferase family 61 protein [Croceicoccus marinus]|jgi:capsular polysaccharide biosynthesis protein|uniref:Glycosyltransferase family 61 protein n=1 Tax=Croceicoccus marinus TaxID=450378 RepID=A0A7G6VSZ8_9SPHN|nr:glycosyltransferase family 61 protein [Croceicoccus marinus]QNE04863.1 glycosyltransferase family 61 protein [Croceicoccus marinus]